MTDSEDIVVSGLCVSSGGREIVRNVSFTVPRGGYVGLLGPSGAGKTTILRAILGITESEAGSVTVWGRAVGTLRRKDAARVMGYVPQASHFRSADMLVHEFLALSRYGHDTTPHRGEELLSPGEEDVMKTTGLSGYTHRRMRTLSGGELQRLLICAAVVQNAPVLLLDEPAAHLDPGGRDVVNDLILRLRYEGDRTVLRVTHDIDHAAQNCDSVVCLRNGRVLFSGSACSVMTETAMNDLFSSNLIRIDHPRNGRPVFLPGGGDEDA